ncbi:MAG: hypothetical protein WCR21_02880 [Bacteroidota bacterium]
MNIFFDKTWKIKLSLFLITVLIYFFHFHSIFFHLNTSLSSITSDAVKNYFTYVYHIQFDKSALHFGGMAYPYGEHVVYTDCQPLLTFVLRCLPFTHHFTIGILHGLIYLSYFISPLILFSIFTQLKVDRYTAFFSALAIGLLSPQFLKINAGHFGLAYSAMIPYSIYLLLSYFNDRKSKVLIYMLIYHCALFLIHPYMGFSICVFSLMVFLFLLPGHLKSGFEIRSFLIQLLAAIGPILLFKIFMVLTDHHPNRTNEPFGLNGMVENIDSILAPVFGPMKGFMEQIFHNRTLHYEGHSYLGFFSILMSIFFMIVLVFAFKKIQFNKFTLALLFAAFILLLISFGLHQKLMSWLGLDLAFMNQFRATCRFAWFFYYALPIFLLSHLHGFISNNSSIKKGRMLLMGIPFFFFVFNFTEAHFMFKMDEDVFWKFRNIFNVDQLNQEEKDNLLMLRKKNIQAIVPLPIYHSGTEMYDRIGFNNSMIPSMLYASQTGIPIFSAMMSRTSMSETKEGLNLLNSYKLNKPANAKLSEGDFLVIKTENNLMPDESRLFAHVKVISHNDSLQIGIIGKKDFLKRKLDETKVILADKIHLLTDSTNVVYIPFENREPYTVGQMQKFTSLYALDSNQIKPGTYVLSLKYHYSLNNYHALACDMIITESHKDHFIWKYMVPMRLLSGFYEGFAVFETIIELDKNNKYEFFIAGREERKYRVSDFMLRPRNTTVIVKTAQQDSSFNNFPK